MEENNLYCRETLEMCINYIFVHFEHGNSLITTPSYEVPARQVIVKCVEWVCLYCNIVPYSR